MPTCRICGAELRKKEISCGRCGAAVLAKWSWGYVNPARTYSPWKRALKEIMVRRLYRKLINHAIQLTGHIDSGLLLKTDLWVECLGLDELESIAENFEIVGIDLSRDVCAFSKPIMTKTNILCSNIRNLPFKSGTFNIVVDISTIDHMHYSEAKGVIAEYARVLKPGGILLVCIDSKLSLLWELYRKVLLKYDAWSWTWRYSKEIVLANDLQIMKAFFANTYFDSIDDLFLRFAGSCLNFLFSVLAQYFVVIARKPRSPFGSIHDPVSLSQS